MSNGETVNELKYVTGKTLNAYTKKSVLNRKLAVNDTFVIFGATLGKTDIWH